MCSEKMQQIYRITPMLNCDFNTAETYIFETYIIYKSKCINLSHSHHPHSCKEVIIYSQALQPPTIFAHPNHQQHNHYRPYPHRWGANIPRIYYWYSPQYCIPTNVSCSLSTSEFWVGSATLDKGLVQQGISTDEGSLIVSKPIYMLVRSD